MTDYTALVENRVDEKEAKLAAKLLLAIAEASEEGDGKDKGDLINHSRELQDNFNHNIDAIVKIMEGNTDESTKA